MLKDDLLEVHVLLSRGWTHHTMARTSDNRPTKYDDPHAVCWCLSGAISRVAAADPAREKAMIFALGFPNRYAAQDWNDLNGRYQVLSRVQLAIEMEPTNAILPKPFPLF